MDDNNTFLEVQEITKYFGEIAALNKVSLSIRKGEIQGLIGENGSGKSTIASIISGMLKDNGGTMKIMGEPYSPQSPLGAREKGISMIVQEKGTVDTLSIVDNIFLGEENRFRKRGIIDRKWMIQEAKKALKQVELEQIDVTLPAFHFSLETRKLIEIAKALYYNPEVLIVDETTTALSQDGREQIYRIMRELKKQNKAILFVSHDLLELIEICDYMTVLRDGMFVETIEKKNFAESYIKKTMVGRAVAGHLYRSDYDAYKPGDVAVVVKDVVSEGVEGISFQLHEGEILGINGLSGSGIHETGRIVAGLQKIESGQVTAYKKAIRKISQALDQKIGYISKDRDNETLILKESIQDNLTISALKLLTRVRFLIFPKDEKRFAASLVEQLEIKCHSARQQVNELSGGNKQKVSFGKLIGNRSRILVLDNPTRGVDVGVKVTMYQLIDDLRKQGCAILLISEELPELLGMSDRILMFKDGKISKEFMRSKDLREVDLIEYMI